MKNPSTRSRPISIKFEAMLADSADLKRLVRSPVFSAE